MKKILFLSLFLTACGQSSFTFMDNTCSVSKVQNGSLITCPNGSHSLIANNGSMYNIVEIINPCGDTPNVYDEVLLKLSNGQILVSFSANISGNLTRFALIGPGNYMTTDGTSCRFTVTNDNNVIW